MAPLSLIQRLGWIDEVESITSTVPFHCFRTGKSYGISSATVEWQKTSIRPRYRAGIRDYTMTDRTRPEPSIAT